MKVNNTYIKAWNRNKNILINVHNKVSAAQPSTKDVTICFILKTSADKRMVYGSIVQQSHRE
jgi:hypothetical protein